MELTRATVAVGDPAARHRHTSRALAGRDRPLDAAVAIAAPSVCALMRRRPEGRGELLGECGVEGLPYVPAEFGFDSWRNWRIVPGLVLVSCMAYLRRRC